MKKTRRNKLINIFLILTMLSHVTYFHDILDNYVICYGTDGHVEIENINNPSDCIISTQEQNNLPNEISFKNNYQDNNCNDISLHSNCFEDSQFLSDKKITSSFNLNCLVQQLPRSNEKENFSIFFHNQKFINQTLQNYSTVTLLI
jgi:hypothetical protein